MGDSMRVTWGDHKDDCPYLDRGYCTCDAPSTRPAAPLAPTGRVTAEELAEVARLDMAATPAPWVTSGMATDEPNVMHRKEGRGFFTIASFRGWDSRHENASLTALLRTVGPKLAAEVTALRAEHDLLSTALDEAGIGCRGPQDTLLARLARLVDDANETAGKLERVNRHCALLRQRIRTFAHDASVANINLMIDAAEEP